MLDDLVKMKRELLEMSDRKQKLQGALEQCRKSLKEEFDCSSLNEAEKQLKEKRKEVQELEQEIDSMFQTFKEKWHGLFE